MTRRPDLPRFANVRTGDMAQCNEPDRPRLRLRWLVIWAIGFALAAGGLALLVGDVPPYYEAPRGYDICQTARC